MTGPLSPEVYAAQGEEVISAEEAAKAAATADLRARLAEIAAVYLTLDVLSEEDQRGMASAVRRIDVNGLAAVLTARVRDAAALGVAHGQVQADDSLSVKPDLTAILPEMRSAPAAVREVLRNAATVAEHGGDSVTVFGIASRGLTIAGQRATWGTNAAHAAGVRAVADDVGAGRLWIAERDACLHCAAYAGIVAWHRAPFPTGLTYAAKPLSTNTVNDPPLHPNCRCRSVVWRPEWGDDYPLSLEREARRSVVRGFSLPSESERQRLLAADRLISSGKADLPKTVVEYGAASVRAGRFRRGRRFPG